MYSTLNSAEMLAIVYVLDCLPKLPDNLTDEEKFKAMYEAYCKSLKAFNSLDENKH